MRLSQGQAVQRPVVEQKEYTGQSHQHWFGHEAEGKDNKGQQVSPKPRMLDIKKVCPYGQHPEKCAQDILALSHPSNRLDMEGMESKKGGNKSAAVRGGGHAVKQEKEQQCVCKVKHQVGEMMAPGVQPKELAVQHV